MTLETQTIYKVHKEMCRRDSIPPLAPRYFEKIVENVEKNPDKRPGSAYTKTLATAYDLAKYLEHPNEDPIMEFMRNNICVN